MRSLDIGATGMLAQQLNVDVISQNIANMTTTGYKKREAAFQDLIYQNIQRPGATSSDSGTTVPSGIQIGLGVRPGAVYRHHSQGAIQITETPLDLALTGDGFFQVDMPNGDTAYTRDGTFQLNENGELVTVQGFTVQPGINIPADATSITVNDTGEVLVTLSGQTATSNVGQIQLASFVNPAGLDAIGDNLLLETDASGSPTTGNPGEDRFGRIRQGALEQSNVNVVEEMSIASGIAVGMATNIPPHNMGEVIDGCLALIDNGDLTIDELMEFIPGPDFPTAGIINGRAGILDAYRTGRGRIYVRAVHTIEHNDKNGRDHIIITELPYQVNKARLIEKIAELLIAV